MQNTTKLLLSSLQQPVFLLSESQIYPRLYSKVKCTMFTFVSVQLLSSVIKSAVQSGTTTLTTVLLSLPPSTDSSATWERERERESARHLYQVLWRVAPCLCLWNLRIHFKIYGVEILSCKVVWIRINNAACVMALSLDYNIFVRGYLLIWQHWPCTITKIFSHFVENKFHVIPQDIRHKN